MNAVYLLGIVTGVVFVHFVNLFVSSVYDHPDYITQEELQKCVDKVEWCKIEEPHHYEIISILTGEEAVQ